MKRIIKITGERFVKSQLKTGPLLNPPQVYILSARHAGKTPRVNSHLVQLGVNPRQENPNQVRFLGTRLSASTQFKGKVGIKFLPKS